MTDGKRLIDLLKEDQASRRREVEVLGVKVFVTPLTVAEQSRVQTLHPDDDSMRGAEILVLKCRDADGNPIFTKDDKHDLKLAVAADRLAPIMRAINGAPAEVQEKN